MNLCTECRSPITQDATFCGECGAPVAADTRSGASPTETFTPAATAGHPEGAWSQPDQQSYPPASPSSTREPYPAVAYPTTASGGGAGRKILLGVAAAALLVGGFFGATGLMKNDAPQAVAGPAPAPTATATPTSAKPAAPTTPAETLGSSDGPTEAASPTRVVREAPAPAPARTFQATPSRPGEGAADDYTIYRSGRGEGGAFERVGTLTSSTSEAFMWSVADAYAASGADGASIVLENVYSSTTGKSYRMTCVSQANGAVVCTGGVNAKVLLYN